MVLDDTRSVSGCREDGEIDVRGTGAGGETNLEKHPVYGQGQPRSLPVLTR